MFATVLLLLRLDLANADVAVLQSQECENALYGELIVATSTTNKCKALQEFKTCAAAVDGGLELPAKLKEFDTKCESSPWGKPDTARERRANNCGTGTQELNGKCVTDAAYDQEMSKLEQNRQPRVVTKDGGIELHVGGAKLRLSNSERDYPRQTAQGDVACAGAAVQVVDGHCVPKVEFLRLDDIDIPFGDLVTGARMEERFVSMTTSVEADRLENMRLLQGVRENTTAFFDKIRSEVLTEMASVVDALKDNVTQLRQSNFACVSGYGGTGCLDDISAPVFDHNNLPARVYLQDEQAVGGVGGKSVRATDVPKPTITDEGPGALTGITVQLFAKTPNEDTLIAQWMQGTNPPLADGAPYERIFNWGTVVAQQDLPIILGIGTTIFEYVAVDASGNRAAATIDVLVGDVDECSNGANTCSEHGECTDLIGYNNAAAIPDESSGTYSCRCKTDYVGDGYSCDELPCIQQSCSELADEDGNYDPVYAPSGTYARCNSNEKVHCEMELNGGGWTLVANVAPTDGNGVGYRTSFWYESGEYGTFANRFSNDYKSPFAQSISGTEMMIVSAKTGSDGDVLGWRSFALFGKTWDSMFQDGCCVAVHSTDECESGSETGKFIGPEVSAHDDILRQGNCVYTDVNPSSSGDGDTIRLTTTNHDSTDNQMSGFASCINCGASWQGGGDSNTYQGLDRAPCDAGNCAHGNIKKMTGFDCQGNYCSGSYGSTGLTPWNSRFYWKN